MLKGIIYYTEEKIKNEVDRVLEQVPGLDIHFYTKADQVYQYLRSKTSLFILIAVDDAEAIKELLHLYNRYPQIYFVYYYHTLNIDNFQQSEFNNFSHIVIGENRKQSLIEILAGLTKNYWKKIPYNEIEIKYDLLSPRLKKAMGYIETHDLKDCSIAKISKFLHISQGYFSQEFKRETGFTFRNFMQRLLAYYEMIIFDRLDLSAKTASQILGYSELSSFSRSFKKRKGYPPSLQKYHKYAELDKG